MKIRPYVAALTLLMCQFGQLATQRVLANPKSVGTESDGRSALVSHTPAEIPTPFDVGISLRHAISNAARSADLGTTDDATPSTPADIKLGKESELEKKLPPVESKRLTDQADDQADDQSAKQADRPASDATSEDASEGTSEGTQPQIGSEPKPRPELSPEMQRLRDRVRACLSHYYVPEISRQRSPWGVMHSLIGYGVDAEIIISGGRRANAIGWLCWNQPCRGMKMLYLKDGLVETRHGPGYQGHEGQFLSMLALSKVPRDFAMKIDGQDLEVMDLVEHEKRTCRPRSELTFKLIGISHFDDSDATWTSKTGESWSIPRLISEELAQPVIGACCGGTHRLMGLSVAVHTREKRKEPVDGQWLRAKKFVDAYHKYAIKMQNRDGSFSTKWFRNREDSGDIDRKLQTTGHILEWLVYSLPENDLADPRLVRSIDFLASHMLRHRDRDWEIGPRGHAIHALAMYSDRVFGDKPGQRRAQLARRPRG